jgi:predicted NBD/HSP70 family sugar kinase
MTPTIGLELRDNSAAAIAVDDEGRVIARAVGESADGLPAMAVDAVDAVTRVCGAARFGIAAVHPEAADTAAVANALRERHRTLIEDACVSSGTAAAVAEAWIGAARGVSDVAFVSVGDHTAAGVIQRGAPFAGSRRRACSIAWLALNPVEREDYRKTGCFEAEVAAAGIVRRLVWRIKAGDHSSVEEAAGDLSAVTTEHVLSAARAGDGVSISVVRDTAKYLGMAAANLIVVVDPEMLVLGGIMATAADLLFDLVRTELARRLPRPMMDALAIAPATLGDDAAAIGAARLAAAPVR